MGLPVELPSPRGQRDDASETSSSDGEEGWVQDSGSDDGAGSWADPSGGVLSQVFDAAEAGDASALTDLLQGLDVSIDTRGADSDTAIHLAALYGHADCVRLLLDAGARADVAVRTAGGLSTCWRSCWSAAQGRPESCQGVAAAPVCFLRSLAWPNHPAATPVILRRCRMRTARCRCTTLQLAGALPDAATASAGTAAGRRLVSVCLRSHTACLKPLSPQLC